jgi:hypothetical protein
MVLPRREGDYNCLHQDLYGAIVFPRQGAILLSDPGKDFDGGEFVLTKQKPRMQSRAHVMPMRAGEALVFAVDERTVKGACGDFRFNRRQGIRTTTGIILQEAM